MDPPYTTPKSSAPHFRHYILGMLTEDTTAPDFTALDQDRKAVSLSDLRGSWVLMWWYPKASTPG